MTGNREAVYLSGRGGREAIHSLRNYVAAATCATRLARDAQRAADRTRWLDAADVALRSGGNLVASLTALTRPNAIATFGVDNVLATLGPLLDAMVGRGVVITFDLGAARSRIRADRTGFESAIVELVTNARDAIECTGRVMIRSRNVGRRTLIFVADTGRGMNPAELDRAMQGLSTKADGSGLGLAQVREFAAAAHGRFRLRGRPGRGTVALLDLPAVLGLATGDSPGRSERLHPPAPQENTYENRQPIAA